MERRYAFGVSLVVIGGVFLSLSGIMLRNIESASGWQILFYRGLAFSLMLFLVLLLKYRSNTVSAFKAIGKPGLWVLCFATRAFVGKLIVNSESTASFTAVTKKPPVSRP